MNESIQGSIGSSPTHNTGNRPANPRGVWGRLKERMKRLKADFHADSIAAQGPTDAACCHKPPEELEAARDEYRAESSRRRNSE